MKEVIAGRALWAFRRCFFAVMTFLFWGFIFLKSVAIM